MDEQQRQQGFEGYGARMELMLHGGRVVSCRAPTLAQVGEILALRRRVNAPGGDDEAFQQLLKTFPKMLGLEDEFGATPMRPSEFLEVVTYFFALPPREPMVVALEPDAAPASSPAGTTS